jgi:hypothetical protein
MVLLFHKRIVCIFGSALSLTLALAPAVVRSQIIPHIAFNHTYGGLREDEGCGTIVQTGDSGFVVAGYTGDTVEPGLPDYHGGFEDAWIVKLDNAGNIVWQKCLGGSMQEECNSMIQTRDGGYCLAIRTESSDGDVVDPDTDWNTGASDGWIVKLTADHQIQWATVIGGSNWDDVLGIIQSDDGGYAVAGYTESTDGCVTGHHGGDTENDDAWITKLDDSGKVQWSRCYGGSGQDWAESIVQTADHGYCFAGFTYSHDNGDVLGLHGDSLDPSSDAWVVKLDSIGNIEWQKCLGGDSTDWATSIALTNDSGFIMTGGTLSDNGDVTENHGGGDEWVVKLTASGKIQWQNSLGGDTTDRGWSAKQTSDGGYITAGMSMSNNGDVSGNHGGGDVWIVKLDAMGAPEWQKCLGGDKLDVGYNIIQLKNGDYAFTGWTGSSNGDILFSHGNIDMWVVTLSNSSSVTSELLRSPGSISLYPQPATNAITIDYNTTSTASSIQIELQNVLGITVYRSNENPGEAGRHEAELDLTSFMPGCYFVTISGLGLYSSAPFQVVPR